MEEAVSRFRVSSLSLPKALALEWIHVPLTVGKGKPAVQWRAGSRVASHFDRRRRIAWFCVLSGCGFDGFFEERRGGMLRRCCCASALSFLSLRERGGEEG